MLVVILSLLFRAVATVLLVGLFVHSEEFNVLLIDLVSHDRW